MNRKNSQLQLNSSNNFKSEFVWDSSDYCTPWQQEKIGKDQRSSKNLTDSDKVKRFLSTTIQKSNKQLNNNSSLILEFNPSKSGYFSSLNDLNKTKLSKSFYFNRLKSSQQTLSLRRGSQVLKCKKIEPQFKQYNPPRFKYNTKQLIKRRDQQGQKTQKKPKFNAFSYINSNKNIKTNNSSLVLCHKYQNQDSINQKKFQKGVGKLNWFTFTHKLNRSAKLKTLKAQMNNLICFKQPIQQSNGKMNKQTTCLLQNRNKVRHQSASVQRSCSRRYQNMNQQSRNRNVIFSRRSVRH